MKKTATMEKQNFCPEFAAVALGAAPKALAEAKGFRQ